MGPPSIQRTGRWAPVVSSDAFCPIKKHAKEIHGFGNILVNKNNLL
jgi:hypothetical protein